MTETTEQVEELTEADVDERISILKEKAELIIDEPEEAMLEFLKNGGGYKAMHVAVLTGAVDVMWPAAFSLLADMSENGISLEDSLENAHNEMMIQLGLTDGVKEEEE